MENNEEILTSYLEFCAKQKRLDAKTIKAYRTDLMQFFLIISPSGLSQVTPYILEAYIRKLHALYRPKSVKRKIASVKALFFYLECREVLTFNPWHRVQTKFREAQTLPRTIALDNIRRILETVYKQINDAKTEYRKRNALRDAAVCELLFATGMRIFELCSLTPCDVDLTENTVFVRGKRAKERILQIGNTQVHDILFKYKTAYASEIVSCNRFFVSQSGRPFSDQAVRRMLNNYARLARIDQHITPHMFRHTFATLLLEADVDIRYIQEMLGHSSIHTTEIYTHVSMAKQKAILCTKHPRNAFRI